MSTVTLTFLCSCLAVASLIPESVAFAQSTSLARPARTVYKCKVDGKIVYSDEPCLGAERIELEPTRGMNSSTGRELIGKDVARERQNELIAEAVKPITGMTPKQFDVERNRVYLPPKVKAECRNLDYAIKETENRERNTFGSDKSGIQSELLGFQKKYRELKC